MLDEQTLKEIKQISKMKGTSVEIEYRLRNLCLDVAIRTIKETRHDLEKMSFESLAKATSMTLPGNYTEFSDEELLNSTGRTSTDVN